MSAGTATAGTGLIARTWSLGPLKIQLMTYAAISGDTTMTATADTMNQVLWANLSGGFVQTAATTYSTNVATFTFTDPAAARYGNIILIGI